MGLKMHCAQCDRVIDPCESKFTLQMHVGLEITPGVIKGRNNELDICLHCVSKVEFLVPHYVEQLEACDLINLFITYAPGVAKEMGIL